MTPFVTVLADPAWPYDDGLTMSPVKRGAASQYPTMSIQEICDLYQPSTVSGRGAKAPGLLAGHPIADTGFLFLWCTQHVLLEGIGYRVAMSWGFTPKQIVPWVKGRIDSGRLVIQPGMGRIARVCVEYLMVCTRGKYSSLVKSHSENGLIIAEEDSVIVAPKTRHSAKPAEAYALIERLTPGPYLELFARGRRENWAAWGFDAPAESVVVATNPLAPFGMTPRQKMMITDIEDCIEWP